MITKNDWNAALDGWVADERERLGGPPTPEEVVAYTSGELPDADAARVRALLVYYPELTSLLTDDDEAVVVDPPARQWPWLPIAAGLLVALLTALLLQSRWELVEQRRENDKPYVHQSRHELQSLHARGAAVDPPVYDLPANEERYLLALMVGATNYADYRLDIVEVSTAKERLVWTANGIQPIDGTFELSVPRALIRTGTFRVDVYGRDSAHTERLESYRVRVRDHE